MVQFAMNFKKIHKIEIIFLRQVLIGFMKYLILKVKLNLNLLVKRSIL